MPGPAPQEQRRRRNAPASGDWETASGFGWQHGDVPDPPDDLLEVTVHAWNVWMGSWFAAFWVPEDLPGLRVIAKLYDQVERGEYTRASELRLQMTAYGMNPEGQQKRHWKPPEGDSGSVPARRERKDRRASSLEVIQGGA